jgi:hypothetical protein
MLDLGEDRREILKFILRKEYKITDQINPLTERDQWRPFVNTVTNVRFPQTADNLWSS